MPHPYKDEQNRPIFPSFMCFGKVEGPLTSICIQFCTATPGRLGTEGTVELEFHIAPDRALEFSRDFLAYCYKMIRRIDIEDKITVIVNGEEVKGGGED